MMKVLLIAPNVDATDVGEALMAFKWAEALSQRTHLTVLCFQRPGRPDVAGQLPRARVVTWPEPTWAMKHERLNAMLKPAWPVFARQVRRWIAAALTTGQSFDIAHQLMPQAARYASPLRHFDVPYIIGPLGGALDTPEAFRAEVVSAPIFTGFEPWTHTGSGMIPGCGKAMPSRLRSGRGALCERGARRPAGCAASRACWSWVPMTLLPRSPPRRAGEMRVLHVGPRGAHQGPARHGPCVGAPVRSARHHADQRRVPARISTPAGPRPRGWASPIVCVSSAGSLAPRSRRFTKPTTRSASRRSANLRAACSTRRCATGCRCHRRPRRSGLDRGRRLRHPRAGHRPLHLCHGHRPRAPGAGDVAGPARVAWGRRARQGAPRGALVDKGRQAGRSLRGYCGPPGCAHAYTKG
jgi:hypothetical protein